MTPATALTPNQQRELQTNLVDALKADGGLKQIFCECWPCAKRVLQLILKLKKLPAQVVAVIKGLIKAGDFAYRKLCA